MAQNIKNETLVLDRHEIFISVTDFLTFGFDSWEWSGFDINRCVKKLTWSASAFPGHLPPRAAIPGQDTTH